MSEPSTFTQLRDFYLTEYRPLYDRFVTEGASAQELHAEVAAAFDHLMRKCGESPEIISPEELDRVVGHIKRATFDAFKVVFKKNVHDPYITLSSRKYGDVHDGKFHQELNELFASAVRISREARALETLSGKIDTRQWGMAFSKWKEILPIADKFRELQCSPEIGRAKAKASRNIIYSILDKLTWAIVGAGLSIALTKLFA